MLLLVFAVSSLTLSAQATSPEEARKLLQARAETGTKASSIDEVRELVEAYRIDSSRFMPLATAPYPRFLINSKLPEIYPALYRSAFNDFLNHIPLEVLFDGVLDMVLKNKVPPSLEEQLSQLSPRMAKQALTGKGEDCSLDPSEKLDQPSMFSLILLKIDVFNWGSACSYRQKLYNAAKASLIAARKTKEVKETVKEGAKDKFPEEFRKGFLEKMNSTLAMFPELIHQKFGAGSVMHPIWTEGSIVETTEESRVSGNRRVLRMKEFAEGLLADLYAARVLIDSPQPRDKSLAAGLFYAVANRWLLLTGGIAADWDVSKKAIPIEKMNEGMLPPKFREARFGGWGVESVALYVQASPWDWEGYSPSREDQPSAIRIFPTRFEVDSAGLATMLDPGDAVQTNEDLGLLLLCVAEFLKETQPGSPFAKFFGTADQVGDLLDAKKPMLFPIEGRMVAVGVLSAVGQNLLHSKIGSVEMKSTGMRIEFRDHGRLPSTGGIQTQDIDAVGVSELLVAGAKLVRVLSVDPILKIEPSLKTKLADVKNIVILGALVVAKSSEQGFQGAFRAKLSSTDTATSLDAQIATLRVLLVAYNETNPRSPFHAAWIAPGMNTLFSSYLGAGPLRISEEQRLQVLSVWNESQIGLRAARPELPWSNWEKVVRAL